MTPPYNNLGGLRKLEWIADTFLVTMPNRANNDSISYVAGVQWGYCEYDLDGKRQVEISPLAVADVSQWAPHLPILRDCFGKWNYDGNTDFNHHNRH